jgi:hypothetical protein
MIVPGRFRGGSAAIACHDSKSFDCSVKLWRDIGRARLYAYEAWDWRPLAIIESWCI